MITHYGEYTNKQKEGAGVFLAPAVRSGRGCARVCGDPPGPAQGTRRCRRGPPRPRHPPQPPRAAQPPPASMAQPLRLGKARQRAAAGFLRGAARLGTGRKDLLAVVLGRLPLVARLSDEVCFRLLSAASVGASALNPLDSLVVLRERGPVTMSFRLSWHSFSLMYVSMAAL